MANISEMLRPAHSKFKQILLLPILALLLNGLVYMGGRYISADQLHHDLTMPIDRMIPFIPWTILIYWGCFFFWIAVYLWMAASDKETVSHFFLMHLIGELICFFFFVVMPTTNVRPPVTSQDIWSRLVRLLFQVDAADNLFPSIHCMISWICWIGLRKQENASKWFRRSSLVWAIAVFISTLTLRQHVIFDVIGAVMVAEFAGVLANIPALKAPFIRFLEWITKG